MSTTFAVQDVKPTGGFDYRKGNRVELPYEPPTTVTTETMFRAKLGKLNWNWDSEHAPPMSDP